MVQGTLTGAELAGGFDAVVFEHSLEHVVEPREDLARAQALLRPGGLVVVAVPNFGSRQARRFRAAWFHLDLPRHRTHFTARGLELLLRESGFDAVELGTSTTPDGLPNSIQYRLFGRRRSSYLLTALSLALLPLTAALAGGDELYASAVRRARVRACRRVPARSCWWRTSRRRLRSSPPAACTA